MFEQRAKRLKGKLRTVMFLGIVVPVIIGAIVLSFGTATPHLWYLIVLAGIVGIVQLILTVWSLVAKWDDALSYAHESFPSNLRLSRMYENLATVPPKTVEEMDLRYQLLEVENNIRTELDRKEGATEEELRTGCRAALLKFDRACDLCEQKPDDMTPSNCKRCGSF